MIIDIFFPIPLDENIAIITFATMNILLLMNIIGLIIGIMSLSRKGYKKTLAIWGIVINSIIPISLFESMLIYLK